MAKYFETGDTIPIKSGGEAKIISKLGEGGQGVVYKVQYNGKPYALKWYLPGKISEPKKFYKNIEANIKKGAPSAAFLWPQYITELYDDSFGYLMDLRSLDYRDFSDFLLAKVHFKTISTAINAALNIVNGFRELHRAGLSYQDINDGNFFINSDNGQVLICDNDNVAPWNENLGIAGKCRYMAPEVVTRKKVPDNHTDEFSLAVVLFMMLFVNHPLEGSATMVSCMSEEFEQKFYGTDPVFIFDDSGTNKPVVGVHKNAIKFWPLFPKFIQDAFKKAFSKESMTGKDTAHRIMESEWQKLFVKLRDSIVCCPACGEETFFDAAKKDQSCINCGKKLPNTFVLKVRGGRVESDIALYPHTKLYRCHIDSLNDDYTQQAAEVLLSKSTPPKLGLRNLSDKTWTIEKAGSESVRLEPGKTVVLANGVKIVFNSSVRADVAVLM